MKRPSFQFYTSDWLNDPALKVCSWEAKGLWIDLLCLMHEGNPYGHLTLPNGKAIDQKMIKKMLNFDEKMAKKFPKVFQELEENGVIKRTENDIFYSKRMVADELERQDWRERQQKLRMGKENKCHENVTAKSHRSSSSPSSSSSKNITPTPNGGSEFFPKFWEVYPRKQDKAKSEAIWIRKNLDAIADRIISAVQRHKQGSQWQSEKGRYIPKPTTFLNGERWEDEVDLPVDLAKPISKDERYRTAWKNGGQFRHIASDVTLDAGVLAPYNPRTSQNTIEASIAFKFQSGDYAYFKEFEIVN